MMGRIMLVHDCLRSDLLSASGHRGLGKNGIKTAPNPECRILLVSAQRERSATLLQVPPLANHTYRGRAMKTLMLGLFLSTLIAPSSYAQRSPAPPTETIKTAATQTPEQQEVINLSNMKWDWMSAKKVDSLETLFDDKAMFTHMGGTWGKTQELATIKSGGIWYKKAAVYAVDARIFGNTAILLEDIDLQAAVGEHEVTNPFMVTEVYIKENDKWKLAQLTFSHLLRPVKMNSNKN
jgi:hypothetical protein